MKAGFYSEILEPLRQSDKIIGFRKYLISNLDKRNTTENKKHTPNTKGEKKPQDYEQKTKKNFTPQQC